MATELRKTGISVVGDAPLGHTLLSFLRNQRTIRDNGRGITEDEKSAHLSIGLVGMRERAYLIGGELDISGVEGEGTAVTVQLPIA